MIGSFSDNKLKRFWLHNQKAGIPSDIHDILRRKLYILAMAETLEDLRVPPANHLEVLKGDRAGCYSIRVNRQWRLVFRWSANTAANVQLVDYH